MPHYDGKPLSDVVDRGPLPVAHAVRFSRQMAGALAEAHDAGIIHRDVKPANVMITEGSAVKLLDFGIARVLAETRLTEPGRRMGTAAYMSPEQVTGDPVTPATDVWALGVVLYEMLAGVRPFGGDSRLALYRAIVHDAPTSIADRRADVPPLLQAILGRCLQKPRADRYADARAVEEDLEDVPV
jgi:serine/threonine-protein kinase